MTNYFLHTPALVLRDSDEHTYDHETDVLVASGDYFVTIASSLDALNATLRHRGYGEQPELEKAVRQLLYLQRRYKIVAKSAA